MPRRGKADLEAGLFGFAAALRHVDDLGHKHARRWVERQGDHIIHSGEAEVDPDACDSK